MHFVVSQKFPLLHYNKYFENYSVKEQQYSTWKLLLSLIPIDLRKITVIVEMFNFKTGSIIQSTWTMMNY